MFVLITLTKTGQANEFDMDFVTVKNIKRDKIERIKNTSLPLSESKLGSKINCSER